ncbi:MAG: DUF4906 domain-containing protein [Bacteroidales bacterium]|nr:DUF4906 domain-containing protein [Bacteroidales bacterium]
MKKYLIFFFAASVFAACQHKYEDDFPAVPEGAFSTVTASLVKTDMTGWKSVCSARVEQFVEAYLFAFYADDEHVCAVNHVTQADTFRWTLPRGADLEIWALANPPDDALKQMLEGFLTAPDLTKRDLRNLPPFSCASTAALKELDENGRNLPMSAIVPVHFTGVRETLSIPLERLFAKYSLKLNCSRFIRDGWSIRTASVRCVNSNGRVPYFYDGPGAGYAARADDLVSCLDCAEGTDLELLNIFGGTGTTAKPIPFYFPENCQGTILGADGTPAQSWKTVYQDLGARVSACSYLSINMVASKEGVERSFSYRVYPGGETPMNRNFDIVRNSARTLTVTLTPGLETDSFYWTPTQRLSVEPGGTIDIPFETSIENPRFSTVGVGLEWVESLPGLARYRASADAPESTVYALGGDEGFEVSDRVPVSISDRYKLKGTIPPGCVYYQPFRLSVSPYREEWPDDVSPSSLSVVSTADAGQEAIEILSGPHLDSGGWYFNACCSGPRSAADPSETLQIRDGDNNVLGEVAVPDLRDIFSVPTIFCDGPDLTPDGCFILPINGEDCATVNLQFETVDGADVPVPLNRLSLVSSDSAVDDLYVEYGAQGTLDVYLPCWEGIPGLQEFDQSHLSGEPYLQSVSNDLRLHSKTGYVFHSEEITFLIPNPFAGLEKTPPHARIVCGRKAEAPADWTLKSEFGRVLEWHIPKDRHRPSLPVGTVLLSDVGYLDGGTTYTAAPVDGNGDILPYDIIKVPCDNKTCGQIAFRLEVENVRSGEKASALAATVEAVRELEVYANFFIHQRHYPLFSPYDEEAKIQVVASFPEMTALSPMVSLDFLKMTATAETVVHPTKAEAETLGSFWVNYAASLGTHPFFILGTRYIPADSGLSYEIQWNPGPTTGYFNYRVITLWNRPQFDFDLEGFRQKHPDAFPDMHLVPASGDRCRYLQMDDYTRIVLYWERWRSAEWTDGGKGWYLCDNNDVEPWRFASAYYIPRAEIDPYYGRCFFGSPEQSGTDVDPVYGGDPFFIQSACNTFETILDY